MIKGFRGFEHLTLRLHDVRFNHLGLRQQKVRDFLLGEHRSQPEPLQVVVQQRGHLTKQICLHHVPATLASNAGRRDSIYKHVDRHACR
jgi:hypothetical protein